MVTTRWGAVSTHVRREKRLDGSASHGYTRKIQCSIGNIRFRIVAGWVGDARLRVA